MRRDAARLARLLALALLAVAGPTGAARAQVSPGPLSEAHRDLDGTLRCFNCHDPKGSMDRRCLDCHTEVDAMRKARRGLHARVEDRACARCHPEHGGRAFRLIAWEEGSPEAFDHTRAGYPLEGAHARLECRACHAPRFQRSPVARFIRQKDRARSWLGLEKDCASCHEDAHAGQLDRRCERCHTPRAWAPAAGFDHAKTDYPLTGRHAAVECARCHRAASLDLPRDAGGGTIPRYRPLNHRDCAPCHRDPHAGRFRGACASCHSTAGFGVIDRRGFDHDVTRYPLRGRHAALACAKCHDPRAAWGKKPAFARCDGCHADAHAGQATRAGRKTDCAACHTVQGFHPSSFSVAAHDSTSYPLAGAHRRADCSSCHAKLAPGAAASRLGPARVAIRPAHERCEDCHADPHRGRFARGGERPKERGCLACHDLERFRPSQVDVARHAAYGWALEGGHRAVPCQACHAELRQPASASSLAGAPSRALAFAIPQPRCASCHETPHGDQFDARPDRGACESCHGADAFVPAARFDHDRDSRFRLDGAHERIPCASCHRAVRAGPGRARVIYRLVPTACESCHAGERGIARKGTNP